VPGRRERRDDMNARSRIATAAFLAGRQLRIVFDFATAARPKPDDEFRRKMTLFLVIVIAVLTMVLVRKLMGYYP
jgi:hypothetical protein